MDNARGKVEVRSSYHNPEVDKKIDSYRIVGENGAIIHDSIGRGVLNQPEINDYLNASEFNKPLLREKNTHSK